MTSWNGQSDRDHVLEATDLVQLIGEHVPVRPKGREHVCICPFHDDTNPSMHIVTHKGNAFYKCFACGAAGTAIDFVMAFHRKDFVDALRFLADRAGIELQGAATPAAERGGVTRESIREANALALTFFRNVLAHEQAGTIYRQEIEQRRISPEMVEAFRIGAAPKEWDALLDRVRQRGHSVDAFLAAGLFKPSAQDRGPYDAFRHRLVFPIFDEFGTPVAFGGRRVDPDDEPKYLNSPETPVFDKSSTLFGLNLAKRSIIDSKTAIVTEGYTDVIACHQAGISNAVGTLGTALTARHARILSRLCDTVVMVFDGDEAGQRAADRAVGVFFEAPLDLRICTLPDGLDPDDLLRQPNGTGRFEQAVAEATDALVFKVSRLQRQVDAIESVAGRQRVLDEFITELADLGFSRLQGVRKRAALTQIADRLELPLGEVEAMLASRRPRTQTRSEAESKGAAVDITAAGALLSSVTGVSRARRLAEYEVLALLIHEPEAVRAAYDTAASEDDPGKEPIQVHEFADALARPIAELVLSRLRTGSPMSMQMLLDACPSEESRRVTADLFFAGQRRCEMEGKTAAALMGSALDALRRCGTREEHKRLSAAGGSETNDVDEQLKIAQSLIERRRSEALKEIPEAIAKRS